jgi:hypothetical protein
MVADEVLKNHADVRAQGEQIVFPQIMSP